MMPPPFMPSTSGNGNGNGLYLPDGAAFRSSGVETLALPRLVTPGEISERVRTVKAAREELRQRMEKDYKTYRLEWTDARWAGVAAPVGQSTYVSAEPQTFANRMIAILASAKMNAQVIFGANSEGRRAFGQAKEQFFIGALRQNDRRLERLRMPHLQQLLSFAITVRGWYDGRAMLIKGMNGETVVDVSPFDPLHTYYGEDADGLAWVCHVTLRSKRDIKEEFGVETPLKTVSSLGVETGEEVYDYYDRHINGVVTGQEWLKEPALHSPGNIPPEVPCFIGAVGPAPLITRIDDGAGSDGLALQGESVYAGLRELYDVLNQTMSDRLTLVRRSVGAGLVYKNVGGRKTIKGDPWAEGAKVSIDINETLTPLELRSMAQDTDALLAHILGEIQRKSFSYISYGGVDFPLSGYAINSLSQRDELTIFDRLVALVSAYNQIAGLLCRQYGSGAYQPIQAMGQARKGYFQATIEPQMVSASDDMIIEFFPKLPRDEPGAYATAQIAREGDEPLLSDRTILDEILKIQDVDAEAELKLEQKGDKMAVPIALMDMIKMYQKRGETEKAMFYMQELQLMLMQPPGGTPGPPDGGGNQNGVPGNMSGVRPQERRPEAKVNTGYQP